MTPDDLVLVRCQSDFDWLGWAVIHKDEVNAEAQHVFSARAYSEIVNCAPVDYEDEDDDVYISFVKERAAVNCWPGELPWFSAKVEGQVGAKADSATVETWFHALQRLRAPKETRCTGQLTLEME